MCSLGILLSHLLQYTNIHKYMDLLGMLHFRHLGNHVHEVQFFRDVLFRETQRLLPEMTRMLGALVLPNFMDSRPESKRANPQKYRTQNLHKSRKHDFQNIRYSLPDVAMTI